jgi:hypothetical protein
MIVLDEDGVAQRLAVIRAPAEEDRPFLKRTEARDRLSRVEDGHGVSTSRVAEPTRQGGDTGEVLEKVQGDSFGLQDGSPIAFDLEETVSILCAFSILAVDGKDEGRIHGPKGLHGCGKTGDHQRLLGDDARARWCGREKECGCRDVAKGEIFLECTSNGTLYVGNRGPDHRLRSQHGAQLLLTADEHGLISAQACTAILVIGNDLRRSLGGKLLIPQFPLQPLDLLGLLGLLLDDAIQRFVEIDVARHRNADG